MVINAAVQFKTLAQTFGKVLYAYSLTTAMPQLDIQNFNKNHQYNGKTQPRLDMSELPRLRRAYRAYVAAAITVAVILLIVTVILAILLYQKIHNLDQAV
ncbi:hypothetical protein OESDEN_22784, partial [Oesophagostomum dentatum]